MAELESRDAATPQVVDKSIMNTVTCDGKTLEMRHLANKEELKQFVNLVMADDEHFFNTEKDVLHEWKLFPDAFIGFFNEDGDLIGHSGAFPISESFGYVSHFIVHPSYRKQGLASALLTQSLKQLHPRNTVLHASTTAEYYYQKRGFNTTNTYVIQYRLSTSGCARVSVKSNVNVRCLNGEKDVEKVLEYDLSIHPSDRGRVMGSWVQSGDTVIACDDEGHVVGYVTAKMTDGITILSPWYADTPEIALVLLKNIAQKLEHDYPEMRVYIFSENKHEFAMVQPFLVSSEPLERCPMLTTADMDTSGICWDRLYGFCLASSIV